MYSRYRSPINPLWFIGVVLVLLVCIPLFISYQHQSTRTITVCSKERAATDNGAEYRIYAAEGTFVMKDSLIGTRRFNTADAYARIQNDTTYKVTTKGWRVPFLSGFPNILKATKLPADQQTPEKCADFG